MKSVLVLDDEPGILSFLERGLKNNVGLVETAGDLSVASALLERCHFDLIISDIRLPDGSGVDWLLKIREQGHQTPVIFMTAFADLQTAIDALRVGAVDFLMKPFRLEQMQTAVDRCLQFEQLRRENDVFRRQLNKEFDTSNLIGECKEMVNVCHIIKQVAPMPSTILLEGESGTGKELAARAIHELSNRKGNFVSINCGAMSAELLESELFGHVKGAFTSAHQAREGLFAFAKEGTLMLDEIGEMPLAMQVHLLRVLDEHSIRPVGSNTEIKVDVRVIAATNRNLTEEVKKGNFREDLFYRLNVLSLRMPPLRERRGDTELLSKHFMNKLSIDLGVMPQILNSSELQKLESYRWPGNVRELKNVIERSLLLGVLPSECVSGVISLNESAEPEAESDDDLLLEVVEKKHILKVLEQESGNKSSASRLLGVSRKTMERKLKAWGLFE